MFTTQDYINHYKTHNDVEFLKDLPDDDSRMKVLKDIYDELEATSEEHTANLIIEAARTYMVGNPHYYELRGDACPFDNDDARFEYWNIALTLYSDKYGDNYLGIAELYEKMAAASGPTSDCLYYYQLAIDVRTANNQEDSNKVLNDYLAMHGLCHSRKEAYDERFKEYNNQFLVKASEVQDRQVRHECYELICKLESVKETCFNLDKFDEARELLISELPIAKRYYGEDNSPLIYIYQDIAITFDAACLLKPAIEYFKEAEQLCKTNLVKAEGEALTGIVQVYSVILDDMADCYEELGDLEKSLETREKLNELKDKYKLYNFG